MSSQRSKYLRFGIATVVVVVSLGYLAWTGVEQSKSYYVTIKELRTDKDVYAKRLRVAGNVAPGSIRRQGAHVEFTLMEEGRTLPVEYTGTEAPPDTFVDNSQAMAEGRFGRDGIFHATGLQAKCASKYAPRKEGAQPGGMQTSQAATPASGMSK
jgi:cytochrome c-type biogenesis protein CcmE